MTEYDPKIWKSTSNKYRIIARLPEGLTALQALAMHEPGAYNAIMQELETRCASIWRRRYARDHSCQAELSQEEWDLFRQSGGETCWP